MAGRFGRFNPFQPRDSNGRWTSTGSVGVRVSTRSASLTAGRRVALVPGKVNLYVGGLVRVENASRTKGPISRASDRLQDRLVSAIPDGAFKRAAAGLSSKGQFRDGSTLVQGSTGRRAAPTIRATRSSGSMRRGGATYTQNPETAQPTRRPRAPRKRVTRQGNSIDMSTSGPQPAGFRPGSTQRDDKGRPLLSQSVRDARFRENERYLNTLPSGRPKRAAGRKVAK